MFKARKRQGSTLYAPTCVCCEEAHVTLRNHTNDLFKFIWECDECGSQFDYVTGEEVHHERSNKSVGVCVTVHGGIGNRVRYLPYQGNSSSDGYDSSDRDEDEFDDEEDRVVHAHL